MGGGAAGRTPSKQPLDPVPNPSRGAWNPQTWDPQRSTTPNDPSQPGPYRGGYQPGYEGMHNDPQYQQDLNVMQMIQAMYGPQVTSASNQLSSLYGQLGIQDAQFNDSRNSLYAKYGIDQNRLSLASQANANALGDISQAKDFSGQWGGLYDEQLANTLSGFGLDREQIDLAMQGVVNDETRLALKSQGLDIDEILTKDNAGRDARALANQQAAGGAWFSPEHGAARSDIKLDMDSALDQIDLARQGLDVDQSDLDITRKNLDLDLKRIGLSESAARLTRKGQQIQLDEKNANLSQTERDILLAAKELGINSDELNWKLNSALTELGWDHQLQLMAASMQEEELKSLMSLYDQMLNDVYTMTWGMG